MANNNEKKEIVLTNREKENFRREALKELNDTIKKDLVNDVVSDVKKELNKVVNDVKDSIDIEYKEELKTKLTEELSEDIKDRIKKDEDKLNRKKSWRIFRQDLLIVILLIVLGFIAYVLYKNDDFGKVKDQIDIIAGKTTTTTTTTTRIIKNNDWYVNEYGYLMDNIRINNFDILNKTSNIERINMSDKISMAYLNVDESKIVKDGVLYQVTNEDVKEQYELLFADEYKPTNFMIDNINYVYSIKNDAYIAMVDEEISGYRVVNNILTVMEDKETLTFKCSSYLTKDNIAYSIVNQNESGTNITFKTISYVFTKGENGYRLSKVLV